MFVAAMMRVSKMTVYRMVHGGELPAVRVGRSFRVPEDEVQKYLSLTKHMYNPQAVLVSKKFWDQLSDTEKQIMRTSCQEARDYERSVSRDGQSSYYLNGARCRRRDITDLFLGTGLGARSYSIIEQGMISQIIEARPEDLRVYLEEAAGISKYKERRKETETRIKHTRENLDRLTDLREEVDKQIDAQLANAEGQQVP